MAEHLQRLALGRGGEGEVAGVGQHPLVRNITALVSVVIDSSQPGPVHVKVWPGADYFKPFRAAMQHCVPQLDLWQTTRRTAERFVGPI